MSTVRLRRLQADYQQLRELFRQQPRIRLIQAAGDPPERYQLEYQIKSLRQVDDQLKLISSHTVEISLPLSYPRMPPQCRMLTPIFHPNIAPHAICIGDHWSPGEPLCSMVTRIGEMIGYQSYNIKSPLNGEAARWVEQNLHRLPLDPVILFVDTAKPMPPAPVPAQRSAPAQTPQRTTRITPPPPPPTPKAPSSAQPQPTAAPPAAADAIVIACTGCKTQYRVSAQARGKWVRCKKCQNLIAVPTEAGP
jgi:predicted Zn finger-like uncharacterized protein